MNKASYSMCEWKRIKEDGFIDVRSLKLTHTSNLLTAIFDKWQKAERLALLNIMLSSELEVKGITLEKNSRWYHILRLLESKEFGCFALLLAQGERIGAT